MIFGRSLRQWAATRHTPTPRQARQIAEGSSVRWVQLCGRDADIAAGAVEVHARLFFLKARVGDFWHQWELHRDPLDSPSSRQARQIVQSSAMGNALGNALGNACWVCIDATKNGAL